MKSKDDLLLERLERDLTRYLKEASDPQAQFALGYRRAQDNYKDRNIQKDFTGYNDSFKKGYAAGLKDARFGKFSSAVTNILTNLGSLLSQWNLGNRSKKY